MNGAIAAASSCGIRPRDAVAALLDAPQVPGRMENIGNAGGATVFVDYAHTPDALENACRTLRELDPRRLITVFGCGGDRDRGKRPLMGAVAATEADVAIATSDNPRSEDPSAILDAVLEGTRGPGATAIVERIEDRRAAIERAVALAGPRDVVLITGKGHEQGQTFADRTVPFDDRVVAREALAVLVADAGGEATHA